MGKIESLVTGKLIRDAERKVSKMGKDYVDLRVGIDGETVCRCLLFGTEPGFADMQKGDTVALVGALEATVYEGKVSLTLLAHHALAPGIKSAKAREPSQSPPEPEAAREPAPTRKGGDGGDGRRVADMESDVPF